MSTFFVAFEDFILSREAMLFSQARSVLRGSWIGQLNELEDLVISAERPGL